MAKQNRQLNKIHRAVLTIEFAHFSRFYILLHIIDTDILRKFTSLIYLLGLFVFTYFLMDGMGKSLLLTF